MIVRPATEADLPTLREFEQGIIAAERPFDPTLAPDPISYYDLAALIASRDAEVLVAVDGEVVGSGYVRIAAALPFLAHRQYGHIGFIYVKPSHRGRGISTRIMEELEAWARGRGITELRLEVYSGNAPAIGVYERAGYSHYLITMRKPTH